MLCPMIHVFRHMPTAAVGQTNRFVADPFVGNAAVHGESYQWHIDADPTMMPGCESHDGMGDRRGRRSIGGGGGGGAGAGHSAALPHWP